MLVRFTLFAFLLATVSSAPCAAQGTAAGLANGKYVCNMSAAGGQFPIAINNGSYTDRGGNSGSYSVDGKNVTFKSGSLMGQYSEVLGPGKFGLSTKFNGMFYGVCDLKP